MPNELEEQILRLVDVEAIRQGYISGAFSVEDVVTVYAKRCVDIGRSLCLSTVECIQEALEIAKEKDT